MAAEFNRRENYIKLGIVLLIVLFSLYFACPPKYRPFLQKEYEDLWVHLGLDLKGGSELLYRLDPETTEVKGEMDPTKVIGDTISVISQRIYNSGIVKEPRIQQQETDKILIQLPGLNEVETDRIKYIITQLGRLEFRLRASEKVGDGVSEVEERQKKREAEKEGKTYSPPDGYSWFPVLKDKQKTEGVPEMLVWVKDGHNFVGKKFKSFFYDFNSAGQRVIGFELRDDYKEDFAEFTGKNVEEKLSIIFNGKIYASPVIKSRLDGRGIMEGFGIKEMRDLKDVLTSGSIDIKPELINQVTVGPSLGEDSIRLGIQAALIGSILVFAFMVFYYHFGGIIASIALALNIVILMAVLVITRETLTLPGIAGIALTVGMAIDANIIIFERIREEQDYKQKLLKDAIITGYKQAMRTILDSNITTLITGFILYTMGSGPIKGFGFTLSVGIIISFFTAVFVTKEIFFFLFIQGWVKEDSKLKMLKIFTRTKIDFMGKWPYFATLAVLLIGGGLTVFYYKGPDKFYGLDFKGGVLAQISLDKPLTTDEVRKRIPENFKAEVQQIYREGEVRSQKSGGHEFAIRLPNLNQDEILNIETELAQVQKAYQRNLEDMQTKEREIAADRQDWRDERKKVNPTLKALKEKLDAASSSDEKAKIQAEIDETSKTLNAIERDIKAKKEALTKFASMVSIIRSTRNKLLDKKSQLSGIFELKKIIQDKFANELSPEAFTDIVQKEEKPFEGYYSLNINFRDPLPLEFVKDTIKKLKEDKGFDDAIVRSKGEGDTAKTFALLIKGPDIATIKEEVNGAFKDKEINKKTIYISSPFPRFVEVSGVVAQDLKAKAFRAIFMSLIGMLLYITIRWSWQLKYGVAAVMCLTHDVLISIGAIAVFSTLGLVDVGLNLTVVAALLTIVGYSINNTIVVFDRIREYISLPMTDKEIEETKNKNAFQKFLYICNRSINQTLTRTIYTSFTTLEVLLPIFIINYGIGGELEGFAFVLVVGVTLGTYSSVCLASPIVAFFQRLQSKKRR